MADLEDIPEADRTGTAPHPRHTHALIGQEKAEAAFLEAFTAERLHHGWLLSGPRGIGKATLAWRIARFLLSQPLDDGDSLFGAPQGPTTLDTAPDLPICRRIAALSEPGLFLLRHGWDEKKKRLRTEITVNEVRKLHGFFALSAAEGGRRVVIVDSADAMNTSAANALLKLLEEPPARATLLLISHQPARLLPTIRSRCRALPLAPLGDTDLAEALAACGYEAMPDSGTLALAQGSVGAAVDLIESGGGAIYADLTQLWQQGPMSRPGALKLAESMTGAANRDRLEMFLRLCETFLARLARAGLMGPPTPEACAGESAILTRLSPHDRAARGWADLSARVMGRARHALAVNLDPGALVLDMLGAIDAQARAHQT